MGVNMDLIKQRAQEEEAKALARSAGPFRFWTPVAGKNKIRIMPPWTDEGKHAGLPYREVYTHFKVGLDEDSQKTLTCVTKTPSDGPKQVCVICAYIEKLRATQQPGDAELAQGMAAKQRFLYNIVDLNDPVFTDQDVAEWKASQQNKDSECPFAVGDTKLQVYTSGSMVWGDLMNIFSDAGVDITDFNSGHDVILTREGKDRRTKYSARANMTPSPFILKGRPLVEAQFNLDKLSPFPNEQQINDAMLSLGAPVSAGSNGAPSLPPPSQAVRPPQPQLPPTQAAPAPAPAPQAAPTVTPSAQVVSPPDAPGCYGDKETCNPDDQECVGGQKGKDIYDPCPFFQNCHTIKFGPSPEKKAPSRRTAAKRAVPVVPNITQSSDVDDLEAEMRNALKS